MKRSIKGLVATFALLLTAGAAWAYPVAVGDYVYMYAGDNPNVAYEGHYQAANVNNTTAKFGVFCVEQDEYFYPTTSYTNTSYKVESISDVAYGGGLNTNNGDTLDYATKWLYSHFMAKDILSKVSGINAYNLDFEIQEAIWKIEGEYPNTALTGDAKILYETAIAAQNSQTQEMLQYDVKVMNLVYANGGYAQSQLMAQPVPEPSTLLLLGAGILGLGFARKRFAKK